MSYFLEALVTVIFARCMYIPRFKLPVRILIYIVLYGCATLTHSGNSILNVLVDVMTGVLVFGFVYTGNPADSFFYAAILVAVNFLCELEIVNIVNHFHVGFLNVVFKSNLRYLLLLARAVLFLIAMIIVYSQKKRKQTEKVEIEGFLATGIVLCILILFAALTKVLMIIPDIDKGSLLVFIALLISLIVLVLQFQLGPLDLYCLHRKLCLQLLYQDMFELLLFLRILLLLLLSFLLVFGRWMVLFSFYLD